MTDAFERSLAAMLAPPEREPDRAFVLRVNTNIALAQRLEAQRSALVRGLLGQFAAVAAMAAAVMLVGQSPAVARFAAESGPEMLLALLVSFSFLAVLLVPGIARGAGVGGLGREFAST